MIVAWRGVVWRGTVGREAWRGGARPGQRDLAKGKGLCGGVRRAWLCLVAAGRVLAVCVGGGLARSLSFAAVAWRECGLMWTAAVAARARARG
jgi:hypothetical protein